MNSRYLVNEAALAHYFGLLDNLALLSVTATPADALGLGHRLGRIQKGKRMGYIFQFGMLKTAISRL